MKYLFSSDFLDHVLWNHGEYLLTVGDLLIALLLIAGGWLISRLIARAVRRHLIPHIGTAATARTLDLAPRWTFFLLWSLFILAALRVLGIPLTIFNFLGGAIALGFGFGAQNFCSNVISGVIILITRPFRAGDTVEVDGQPGTVLTTRLRATEVRTYDGYNLLVPNSYFLSNTIVNRTNHERHLRGNIVITTTYATDSRAVETALCAVAAAHPAVLTTPGKTPWVVLENFGNSGLEFKLYFWVDTTRQNIPTTSSDIRHAILTTCREQGITIPYPQLDVHLTPPA